jgi:uncharacterized heparinase superfamily protein
VTLVQLFRSAVHTRPSQLAERLKRLARQHLHDLCPARTAARLRGPAPALSESLPQPVFEPRDGRILSLDGLPRAAFLNTSHSLCTPIEWNPALAPALELLNLHYMEYLEALDDAPFERVVRDWIEGAPLARRGSWTSAWNGYALSLRALVWMQQLAVRRERLTPEFLERAHTSLVEQLRFLETHLELDIGGNHLIKNAKTLLWAGAYFAGAEAKRWRSLGEALLTAELDEQILADGMHYERSPAYHTQVFADFVECAGVASAPLRERLVSTLRRMAQALVDLTHPDGAPSLFNDGGLDMAYSTEACLAAAESLGLERPAARERFELRDAGYFGARVGSNYLLVDCGAVAPDHLPAHGHGDALAFEWTLQGQRIIVDAGVFEYERGPLRDEVRATRSHNTLTLDDLDQSEFWSSFRVGRRARVRVERFEKLGQGFVLEGSHDGYSHLAGSPRHRRRIIAARESLVIDDEVVGGARQSVRARLLLHPDVRVETGKHDMVLRRGEVVVVLETRGALQLVDAWWYPDFGVKHRTKQIVVTYPPAPSRGFVRLQRVPAESFVTHTGWTGFFQRVA